MNVDGVRSDSAAGRGERDGWAVDSGLRRNDGRVGAAYGTSGPHPGEGS